LRVDEALNSDAKPPLTQSKPNDNLGISEVSASAPLGSNASEVSANFDAEVALLPEPNTLG
jgi:hypothetical protein